MKTGIELSRRQVLIGMGLGLVDLLLTRCVPTTPTPEEVVATAVPTEGGGVPVAGAAGLPDADQTVEAGARPTDTLEPESTAVPTEEVRLAQVPDSVVKETSFGFETDEVGEVDGLRLPFSLHTAGDLPIGAVVINTLAVTEEHLAESSGVSIDVRGNPGQVLKELSSGGFGEAWLPIAKGFQRVFEEGEGDLVNPRDIITKTFLQACALNHYGWRERDNIVWEDFLAEVQAGLVIWLPSGIGFKPVDGFDFFLASSDVNSDGSEAQRVLFDQVDFGGELQKAMFIGGGGDGARDSVRWMIGYSKTSGRVAFVGVMNDVFSRMVNEAGPFITNDRISTSLALSLATLARGCNMGDGRYDATPQRAVNRTVLWDVRFSGGSDETLRDLIEPVLFEQGGNTFRTSVIFYQDK
ncbi:hypothetical protein KKC08_00050 [Patescibacteria group bacterium]|nr:hypothetical protein [Patescibacteria group bacterium]MCG2701607.1 hypothetical protein [Candidatus Parcubacteria bacterium]MBU4264932.1 hypothetical protein [Patescibacteria group bacterium]MBU4389769.1 hypothetical protein [Patescibacteria group bacterium]MBU4396545.1 hypothetical protein [Patescibacteria group bacterium]